MNRGLPGGSGPGALSRLPFVRSLSYHTRRVLGHPFRTGVKVLMGLVLLVGAYLLTFERAALVRVFDRESYSVLDVLGLVDPWLWPTLLVGGTVLVVVLEIWTGVQQDMRYGRGR